MLEQSNRLQNEPDNPGSRYSLIVRARCRSCLGPLINRIDSAAGQRFPAVNLSCCVHPIRPVLRLRHEHSLKEKGRKICRRPDCHQRSSAGSLSCFASTVREVRSQKRNGHNSESLCPVCFLILEITREKAHPRWTCLLRPADLVHAPVNESHTRGSDCSSLLRLLLFFGLSFWLAFCRCRRSRFVLHCLFEMPDPIA